MTDDLNGKIRSIIEKGKSLLNEVDEVIKEHPTESVLATGLLGYLAGKKK